MVVIVASGSLEDVARRVAEAVDLELRPRESGYYGDPYFSAWPESELKLTFNSDPMHRQGEPEEDRLFVASAPDAQFVVWDAGEEDEVVRRLRARGLEARVAAST